MNCKPGDLAIVVKMHGVPKELQKLLGRIVRVTYLRKPLNPESTTAEIVWHIENKITIGIFEVVGIEDQCLRPLRDNDGVDETLLTKEIEHV